MNESADILRTLNTQRSHIYRTEFDKVLWLFNSDIASMYFNRILKGRNGDYTISFFLNRTIYSKMTSHNPEDMVNCVRMLKPIDIVEDFVIVTSVDPRVRDWFPVRFRHTRTRPMLSPMDGNIPPTTPPSTPPSKRRRVDAPDNTRFPSFEEEPHSSPAKLGELGLHVLLSPKNEDTRNQRMANVARSLTFGDDSLESQTKAKVESTGEDEVWERPRESMYVTAFNTAVDTVIEREGHLFSSEEMNIIAIYRSLPCTSSSNLD